jgi:hypothetical protein
MAATLVTERQYQGHVHEHSRRLMSAWMGELGRAEAEGRPTGALMISGNCVELLRACHILPMFPEVTALQNAIRHKSLPLILKAEQAGYSSDNCAYVKADIGLFLEGGMGPGKPIPFPTITVCNYVGCNVYVKWFEHLADVSGSKLFMLDVPFARAGEPSEADSARVSRAGSSTSTSCARPWPTQRAPRTATPAARISASITRRPSMPTSIPST